MEIKALDKLTYGLYVLGVEGENGYGGYCADRAYYQVDDKTQSVGYAYAD